MGFAFRRSCLKSTEALENKNQPFSAFAQTGRRYGALARERPVHASFVVALGIRLLAVAVISLLFDGFLFSDDVTYHQMATQLATDMHGTWDPYTQYLFDTTATFLYPLTAMYELFGPRILLAQFLVAVMGAGAAGVIAAITMAITQRRTLSLFAGLTIALLPSQVLWSSVVLKDSQVWLLISACALMAILAQKATGRRLIACLSGLALLLLGLAFLREHTMVIASLACAITFLVPSGWGQNHLRAAGGFLILILVPWISGYGIAGTTLIFDPHSLEQRRINNAKGADSAFVEPVPHAPDPATKGTAPETAADTEPAAADTEPEAALERDLAHLPRGLAYILLAPFPWETEGSTAMQLARLESVIWYPLFGLALIGLVAGFRHPNRPLLLFPALAGAGSAFVYALSEGNVGTAFRHRGEFVWAVVVFAAIALERVRARRTPGSSD